MDRSAPLDCNADSSNPYFVMHMAHTIFRHCPVEIRPHMAARPGAVPPRRRPQTWQNREGTTSLAGRPGRADLTAAGAATAGTAAAPSSTAASPSMADARRMGSDADVAEEGPSTCRAEGAAGAPRTTGKVGGGLGFNGGDHNVGKGNGGAG
jgi:hypothetical protein